MLVSIISPLSELGIECRFFCCIPYSLRNILVNFEIFSQPFEPVEHWFNMLCWAASVLENTSGCFSQFSLIRTRNRAPFFLLDSLFFKEYSVKISYFFSTELTGQNLVQPVRWASLHGAQIFCEVKVQIQFGLGPYFGDFRVQILLGSSP